MKPPLFDYHDPSAIEGALDLLAEHGEDAKVLAGGQSLVPLLNFRLASPDHLIDLRPHARAGLHASTRRRPADRSDDPPGHARGLAAGGRALAAAHRGARVSSPTRRSATAGRWAGRWLTPTRRPSFRWPSRCSTRPSTCARATEPAAWAGEDFFITHLTTALEPEELLVEIEVPPVPPGTGWAFTEYARRHGDFALGGAAALITLEDGVCRRARAGAARRRRHARRAEAAERVLEGSAITGESTAEAARAAVADINPTGDIHGSSEYRKQLIEGMVRRAIEQATERAGR